MTATALVLSLAALGVAAIAIWLTWIVTATTLKLEERLDALEQDLVDRRR